MEALVIQEIETPRFKQGMKFTLNNVSVIDLIRRNHTQVLEIEKHQTLFKRKDFMLKFDQKDKSVNKYTRIFLTNYMYL